MKVAVYGRVSTSDRDQGPETQLLPLREFVSAQGWECYGEYVDFAPATDLLHRVQWRQLLEVASKRRF
ncbi:MAG TPA: recombinase family protein, partial [Dehalococcoidia bacterium]|nr:recombinase family protein [Dehalococcoidia bacterium]